MAGSNQLGLLDRQFANPFAGRGENRIAQCRRYRRNARLSHASRRRVVLYQLDMHLTRRFADARHRVVVVVGLLNPAGLRGDFAHHR